MEDTPGRALQAAVDMLARVDALNAARPPGAHELRIGIGIAHGVVIAGNIGSEARMEFTVIGDTVNFAARLQELNKDLNTVIVVSEAVHDAVKGRFALRRLPPVRVRGKSGEVAVWGMGAEPRAPAQRPFEVRVRAGAPGVETA
jgi:adenylate cyclase